MDEAVERPEPDLAIGGSAEAHDDAVYRALAEARAHEMPEAHVETVRDAVGEGASGAAEPGEDGDLRRPDQSSKCRGRFASCSMIFEISLTVSSILPSSLTTT